MFHRPRLASLLAALVGLSPGGCTDGGPGAPERRWEVAVVEGDGQIALPGTSLPLPIVFEVRDAATGEAGSGLALRLAPIAGTGLRVEPTEALTDGEGRARALVRLGPGAGEYRVAASLAAGGAGAEAEALALPVPQLTAVSPSPATAGDAVTLSGSWLWSKEGGRVEFSGFRAGVLSADPDGLRVQVPPCLPPGPVEVRVYGKTGASGATPLEVRNGTPAARLGLGEDRSVLESPGLTCQRVRLEPGDEVLVLALSAAASVAPPTSFEIRGIALPQSAVGPNAAPAKVLPLVGAGPAPPRLQPAPPALRAWLSGLESAALGTRAAASVTPSFAVPSLGQTRLFQVLRPTGDFATVEAEVRYVGEHAAFYAEVGAADLPAADPAWGELAGWFDGVIWDVDSTFYGRVPDLDASGRVALLVTSVVNTFASPGGSGRVGGFFFGADLLPGRSGSNAGEVLYLIRPDSLGAFGPPITGAEILEGLPAVLAHELQHLIHFNERMLERGASRTESTWLSEGLAVMAEDRVADRLAANGDAAGSERFMRGNLVRARDYLAAPHDVSLIITQGAGTVQERGGAWLLLRYLSERFGTSVLGDLTRTTLQGVENVEAVTGGSWAGRLGDWGVALQGDDLPGIPLRFQYPGFDLEGEVGRPANAPVVLQGTRPRAPLALRASSLAHVVLSGDLVGEAALTLAGGVDGAPPASGEIELRLVRLR